MANLVISRIAALYAYIVDTAAKKHYHIYVEGCTNAYQHAVIYHQVLKLYFPVRAHTREDMGTPPHFQVTFCESAEERMEMEQHLGPYSFDRRIVNYLHYTETIMGTKMVISFDTREEAISYLNAVVC